MVYFVHAKITINNDTLPVWLDYNHFFPSGVLIGYATACE